MRLARARRSARARGGRLLSAVADDAVAHAHRREVSLLTQIVVWSEHGTVQHARLVGERATEVPDGMYTSKHTRSHNAGAGAVVCSLGAC